MVITEKNLVRHELIGLEVEVLKSTNKFQVGIKGKVVDETYNTLVILTEKGEKVVAKKDCVFLFKIPNGKKVQVEGWVLVGKPEDRIKKKLSKW
ncbi:MAG: ribonuclease P protein component 1 [Candidatus Aenigmarchaeota archaeon]|nr:ribonuclease P protein component 1 [Candidatus Aenigmarchaeota archaeon]MCX8190980.1 ribonuclease P protein component 1 [Candidatus Aenigmarchaeota archaeon]MDW8160225.1 ribonuclease P protein component 1 [Candidatus Aenigmarchaeota archaeon]